ncbi:MAG: hypothetical protein M0Z81_03740 [Deltaproteobacteria bacterium]|jgi:hypothetical protein|nr:hypothetical protein [Deltaproteobacteria bacterium]
MISKFSRFLVLCATILAVCPLYFPGQSILGIEGPITYYGMEPIVANAQYNPNEPLIVTQTTGRGTQINRSRVEATNGAGIQWVWHY